MKKSFKIKHRRRIQRYVDFSLYFPLDDEDMFYFNDEDIPYFKPWEFY